MGESFVDTRIETDAITEEDRIANVINSNDQELQQSELKRLMAEFTENAPEYEGVGRGLALTKIGFAMAAGQSPNAIENIASALDQGADMLIKDKKDRDAFDRQLQLSAMKYGLTEVGKRRAEARAEKKAGRAPNFFFATEDGELPNGRKYKKDQNFMMTTKEILDFGLPSGALVSADFKTIKDNERLIKKALLEAEKANILSPSELRSINKTVATATVDFTSANLLRQLVQNNIIRNANGEITGFQGAFNDLVGKSFSAVGIEPEKKYTSKQEYDAEMTVVANTLLKELLGEGSKNVSNIDRTLSNEIVGLYKDQAGKTSSFSYVTVPQSVLNNRLQRILVKLEEKERNALTVFQNELENVEGYTRIGGRSINLKIPQEAQDILSGATKAQNFENPFILVDGVYRKRGTVGLTDAERERAAEQFRIQQQREAAT